MSQTESDRSFLTRGELVAEIPELQSIHGWKEIPIRECGQLLVCLNDLEGQENLKVYSQYYLQGIPNSSNKMYLREETAQRLILAARLLPEGYSLVVFDAYRPLEVQTAIFNRFKDELRSQYPDVDEEEIIGTTEVYVALPSRDPKKPSPHATGGAVDLSICGSDRILLEMGTEFDSFDIASRTDYFRDKDVRYHKNRELLFRVMNAAGFTNYPEEWWHYDFGNQFWGYILGRPAIYGLVGGVEG